MHEDGVSIDVNDNGYLEGPCRACLEGWADAMLDFWNEVEGKI